jgi:hypothetical protein
MPIAHSKQNVSGCEYPSYFFYLSSLNAVRHGLINYIVNAVKDRRLVNKYKEDII